MKNVCMLDKNDRKKIPRIESFSSVTDTEYMRESGSKNLVLKSRKKREKERNGKLIEFCQTVTLSVVSFPFHVLLMDERQKEELLWGRKTWKRNVYLLFCCTRPTSFESG